MTKQEITPDINEMEMPFLEHLEELRWRLIKCVSAIFIGAIAVFFFSAEIMKWLIRPYSQITNTESLIFLEPTGGFMIHLEIALFGGIIMSLPVIFYQLWKFIAPGLYDKERGWTLMIIAVSTLSFLIGAAFAYFVMIPIGLKFLLGFQTEMLTANLAIQKYLSFILTLVFVAGLLFELPLVSFFLTKMGLLSAKFLREKRRYGIVVILILAAILTPPDIATQLLLAGPLVVLYEISIFVSYFSAKSKKEDEDDDDDDNQGGHPTKKTDKPPDDDKSGSTGIGSEPKTLEEEKPAEGDASPDDSVQSTTRTPAETSSPGSEASNISEYPEDETYDDYYGYEEHPEDDNEEENPEVYSSGYAILPDSYKQLEREELVSRIEKVKNFFGTKLVILGHHYQHDDIIQFADFQGDSFGLSKLASEQTEAKFIVFAGVSFMAESARILARPEQIVVHPDFEAGCPLAEFAVLEQVEAAWDSIGKTVDLEQVVPITYMNSSSEIKSFCGANNGTVCTSSNAANAFNWAYNKASKIFFFPDENLGWNTAVKLNIPKDQISVWDPTKIQGGLMHGDIEKTRLFLWKGYCHVHTRFTVNDILSMREENPDCKIVVHPECKPEVVAQADANGSTEFIINYVKNATAGDTIIVGTEINLVQRLTKNHPDITIKPLARSLCPNMFKINLQNLCWTLENLGKINVTSVPESLAKLAKVALNQMLKIS